MSVMFQTREEVDKYLSGDKIECLLCGKQLKSLGGHISHTHNMSARGYKQKYGIPLSWPLQCASTRALQRATMQAMYTQGKGGAPALQVNIDKRRGTHPKGFPFKPVPFLKREYREGAKRANSARAVAESAVHEFLRRVESGRTIESVALDADMPAECTALEHIRKDSALFFRWRKAVSNNLSRARRGRVLKAIREVAIQAAKESR